MSAIVGSFSRSRASVRRTQHCPPLVAGGRDQRITNSGPTSCSASRMTGRGRTRAARGQGGQDAHVRPRRTRGRSVPECLRDRPFVHAVARFDCHGPMALAAGRRREPLEHPAGQVRGLSGSAGEGRLPRRRHAQGLGTGTAPAGRPDTKPGGAVVQGFQRLPRGPAQRARRFASGSAATTPTAPTNGSPASRAG